MNDNERDSKILGLIHEGKKCKQGKKIVRGYWVDCLKRGTCSRKKNKECWLEMCEEWVNAEHVIDQSRRSVKPLYIERRSEKSLANIIVDKTGISTKFVKVPEIKREKVEEV